MAKTNYYYLRDLKLTAKETNNGTYVYRNGKWESCAMGVIHDRLLGFDPYEEPGYMMGHTDIMHDIVEITKHEARVLAESETLHSILNRPYYDMQRQLAEYREKRSRKGH